MVRRLKKTHEHLAHLFARVPSLKDILARPFGVNAKTVESWARPKATIDDLYATGKGNPLDRMEKLLEEAHPYDPETAREIAEHFPLFVDELDRRAGVTEADLHEEPCQAMARVAKKHLELVLTGLGNAYNEETLREALKHTHSLKSHVIHLEGCIEKLLKNEETKNAEHQ